MDIKKYYVYVYLDPRNMGSFKYGNYIFDYEPFYVGKGCGDRCFSHLKESCDTNNQIKGRILNKINKENKKPIIVKIENNLIESDAYELETELIQLIGRRCDGTGSLSNILIENKPPSNYIKLPKEIINQIIELYNSGWYLKYIGNELNLNENKVKSVLIENGINPKRKKPKNYIHLNDTEIKKICDLYDDGFSIRKICKKYSLSYEKIRNLLINKNIKLRDYKYKKTKDHISKIIKARKKLNLVGEKSASYVKLNEKTKKEIIKLRTVDKLSIKKICAELNLKYTKVYSTMKELGLNTKNIKNGGKRTKNSEN